MSNESPDDDVTATDKTVPAAANSGASATMGLELQEGRVIPRKQVVSWAPWDWQSPVQLLTFADGFGTRCAGLHVLARSRATTPTTL